MTWSRLDDLYDDHPKVLAAMHMNPLAVALHVTAITASSRRESDGLVDPFWLLARVPDRKRREEALALLVRLGLFDVVAVGDVLTLTDSAGFSAEMGPFDEPRYVVHDYLAYNPSRRQQESSRLWDRRRKDLERDKELVAAIRERDGDRCRYCAIKVNWRDRRSERGGTYDHVEPRGENTFANVVVACRGCNMRKGPRTPDAAGMPLLPPGLETSSPGPGSGQNTAKSVSTPHALTHPDPALIKPPLAPPATAGGEPGQSPGASPVRLNSRALGTNPRQMDAAAVAGQDAAAALAAVGSLTDAGDAHRKRWEALRVGLRAALPEDAAVWGLYVEALELAAVDGDVLVIDGPDRSWAWHQSARLVALTAERTGVRARLATREEHEGLRDAHAPAREAVQL
jgi:5-methylcytosine-specific restriction endonuclease McrA